jgi:hypothetical protein
MLIDPHTKNIMLGTVLARARELQPTEGGKSRYHFPQLNAIRAIYHGTLPGSKARCLLVELYDTQRVTLTSIRKWIGVPDDFLNELSELRKAMRGRKKHKEPELETSRYHELYSDADVNMDIDPGSDE